MRARSGANSASSVSATALGDDAADSSRSLSMTGPLQLDPALGQLFVDPLADDMRRIYPRRLELAQRRALLGGEVDAPPLQLALCLFLRHVVFFLRAGGGHTPQSHL